MTSIRSYQPLDWQVIWPILQTTFATGDTYAYAPDSTEQTIHTGWIERPQASYVALNAGGQILGIYFIKANQTGLGDHVCNCGYVVAAGAQGQGVAAAMCEHSQREAMRLGFLAMQFNLVVSTNERAVRLWKRLGFAVVGTLPGAFRHQTRGLIDALVMFKTLVG